MFEVTDILADLAVVGDADAYRNPTRKRGKVVRNLPSLTLRVPMWRRLPNHKKKPLQKQGHNGPVSQGRILERHRHFHVVRIAKSISQPLEGFGFDLANTLSGQAEFLADFLECMGLNTVQAKPHTKYR